MAERTIKDTYRDLTEAQQEQIIALKKPVLDEIQLLNQKLGVLDREDPLVAQLALTEVIGALLKSTAALGVSGVKIYGWPLRVLHATFIAQANELVGLLADCNRHIEEKGRVPHG